MKQAGMGRVNRCEDQIASIRKRANDIRQHDGMSTWEYQCLLAIVPKLIDKLLTFVVEED